jgi:biotin carboxyl carrier protein
MSSFKIDREITGELDGTTVATNVSADITELSPGHFIVNTDNHSHEIFITSAGAMSDGNALNEVEVKVHSAREEIITKHFKNSLNTNSGHTSTKGMFLKAPMPGMVKAISVSVGQSVQKQTQVIVLEAMKMENSITAGFAGIVKKIHAEQGISVEKNAPLIEFSRP